MLSTFDGNKEKKYLNPIVEALIHQDLNST